MKQVKKTMPTNQLANDEKSMAHKIVPNDISINQQKPTNDSNCIVNRDSEPTTQTEDQILNKFKFGHGKYDKALEMFYNSFKLNIDDLNISSAYSISKSIVEEIIKSNLSDFPKVVRTKSHNLKINPKLCKDVYSGTIGPEEFIQLSTTEMQSEEQKLKDEECIRESIRASQVAKLEADTDMFQCGKCKQKKCTYYQLQTRSCDEPMTTFVTCTVCNNKWKF